MKDMSIHFDIEGTKEVLVPAEREYDEWLELSNSFQGWLLTLNDTEFAYIHKNLNHDFKKDPDNGISFLFTQLEAFKREQHIMLMSELSKDLEMKITGCNLIYLARKGLATYEVAEKDEDWEFELTEEGTKEFQKMTERLKDSYEKRRDNIRLKPDRGTDKSQ